MDTIRDISYRLCHMIITTHRSRLPREAGSPTSGVKIGSIFVLKRKSRCQSSVLSMLEYGWTNQTRATAGRGKWSLLFGRFCMCAGALKLTETALHILSSLWCSGAKLQNHQHKTSLFLDRVSWKYCNHMKSYLVYTYAFFYITFLTTRLAVMVWLVRS